MTFLSYNLNIPFQSNKPSVDQPRMFINTNSIGSWVDVDHYGFGSPTGGQHQMCTLLVQPGVPALRTSGMGTLYAKSVSGRSQLFMSPDATGSEFQLTRVSVTNISRFGTFTQYATFNDGSGNTYKFQGGWSFLPGGLFIQYGIVTPTVGVFTSNPITVSFPTPFTGNTAIVTVSAVTTSNSNFATNIQAASVSATTFGLWTSTSSGLKAVTFYAIGA